MSLVKLTSDRFEQFTLETHPSSSFSSSSLGVTGSAHIFARRTDVLKEVSQLLSLEGYTPYTEDGVQDDGQTYTTDYYLMAASDAVSTGSTNVFDLIDRYLVTASLVDGSPIVGFSREITRFVNPLTASEGAFKVGSVRNAILPSTLIRSPTSHWAYTNYHSLNFFTASQVDPGAAVIYPDSGSLYVPTGAFTVEFYINPRYSTPTPAAHFRAGTLLHLSSTFAVSLVTGSSRDIAGIPDAFRILIQLSKSADTSPSRIDLSTANNARSFPNDLAFVSDDNVLKRNHWHHVAVRWGTTTVNDGSGSFLVDGVRRGNFNIPSSSIASSVPVSGVIVGNYYNGFNGAAVSSISRFFNQTVGSDEGLPVYTSAAVDPTAFAFDHPCSAEIHEIKIYSEHRTDSQIVSSSLSGPEDLDGLLFYVPPFFVREPKRKQTLISPTDRILTESAQPINEVLAFNVGGHEINLEHFLREFVQGRYPRLYMMTASVVSSVNADLSANQNIFLSNPGARRRHLTLLPNDNGLFQPNFSVLTSGSVTTLPSADSPVGKFVNDLGVYNPQWISLRDVISSDFLRVDFTEDPYMLTPENLSGTIRIFSVLQRLKDGDSNNAVFFDVSNLFFGNRIHPESVYLRDSSLSGSGGAVKMTLTDDGNGNLYRADCATEQATWNSVGNVLYDEGIIAVKSPHLSLFGQDQWSMSMLGEQNVHVLGINVACPAGAINSSSNPSYAFMSASANANDEDSNFVYITDLFFHDDNLNVIAKTRLAQPILKRDADRFVFRVKIDF